MTMINNGTFKNGRKKISAVIFQVLDEVGPRTSVEEIRNRASIIMGLPVKVATVHKIRTDWKRVNKVEVNCSTYKGQPARNMVAVSDVRTKDYRKVKDFCISVKTAPYNIVSLLDHNWASIEHLRKAVEDFQEWQLQL